MKIKAAIVLLIIGFAGCEDEELNLAENNFFPLQVGNYWEFHPYAQNLQGDKTVVKMEITTTQEFLGVEYYLMVRKSEGPYGIYIDTAYYRTNEIGFVFQRLKTGEITNPYRLGAKDGERWSSSFPANGDDMSVEYVNEPIMINSTLFENCRVFEYDKEEWIDEEYWTTLAPGIGIVTSHSAWGFRRDLKRAIINGVEYDF